ncbi:MAG: hypothetical protein JXR25_09230 [Pontiellaceae bacterium]|nr:hypothetical protein [Pontiellaceae bacterium]MBN2784997.1 hypothetical protein [Pontiellaceae bacterium]
MGTRVNLEKAGLLLVMLACRACFGQDEEAYDRSRYEVIVERAPFGNEPLVDTKDAAPVGFKVLEKELRLCFLLQSQSGEVRAGFQNQKAKKGDPKSIILMEGESYRSMKLVKIDLENSTAIMEYEGKEVPFELTKAKAAVATAKQPTEPATPQRRFGSGFRRNAEPEEQKPEEPQLSQEELEEQREAVRENLREYQMEVLRSGMPPLPIQLTPEQDDQLVSEGVLPPME